MLLTETHILGPLTCSSSVAFCKAASAASRASVAICRFWSVFVWISFIFLLRFSGRRLISFVWMFNSWLLIWNAADRWCWNKSAEGNGLFFCFFFLIFYICNLSSGHVCAPAGCFQVGVCLILSSLCEVKISADLRHIDVFGSISVNGSTKNTTASAFPVKRAWLLIALLFKDPFCKTFIVW